jgi:adenosylcobinamide-GDP ribazoletransferase
VAVAAPSAALIAGAAAGPAGLVALLLVTLAAHALGRWWTRALGGLTGDTYGALCELAEVVALAALTVRV